MNIVVAYLQKVLVKQDVAAVAEKLELSVDELQAFIDTGLIKGNMIKAVFAKQLEAAVPDIDASELLAYQLVEATKTASVGHLASDVTSIASPAGTQFPSQTPATPWCAEDDTAVHSF
ncbi:hypothetical protein [Paraburkholderia sp. BCC1886]|uniref:hypothetical protein n=1 Tax=Paraburkholderia sp. BCC1886 TaxID=2562670 RepID=UPI001182A24E|nr:hypothetical protein [Paraburkholderia sp. BCC1886]